MNPNKIDGVRVISDSVVPVCEFALILTDQKKNGDISYTHCHVRIEVLAVSVKMTFLEYDTV